MDNQDGKPMYANFNRENKWLGIIEYKSLLVIIIYIFIIFHIIKYINLNFEVSIYLFIFLTLPVVAALCVNINNESLIYSFCIIYSFFKNKKIYINKRYEKVLKNEIYIKK